MPTSRVPWHFVSQATVVVGSGTVPVLDFHADVMGTIEWDYPTPGRLAEDPLGGDPIQVIRASSATPGRRGTLTLIALWGAGRETDRTNIEAARALKGPFNVTTPEAETFALMFNVVEGVKQTWQGGNRVYAFPIYEVQVP